MNFLKKYLPGFQWMQRDVPWNWKYFLLEQLFLFFLIFLNFKIFNSYMRSQTWTPLRYAFLMSPFLVEHVLSFPQEVRTLHIPGFLNLGHLLCVPVETYTKPPLQLEQLILSLCMWFSFLMLFLTSWPWHMLFLLPKNSLSLLHMACPINVSSLSA